MQEQWEYTDSIFDLPDPDADGAFPMDVCLEHCHEQGLAACYLYEIRKIECKFEYCVDSTGF